MSETKQYSVCVTFSPLTWNIKTHSINCSDDDDGEGDGDDMDGWRLWCPQARGGHPWQ